MMIASATETSAGYARESISQTIEIKEKALSLGANLVGVADLDLLKGIDCQPADLLDSYRYAISMAVKLPNAIFEQLDDHPTPHYARVYQQVNIFLDHVALQLSSYIEDLGYRSLPIPASQLLDMEKLNSHLSSKAVANAAGMGWQGKSLLIVTPEYGPRVRFVTLLTDMDMDADSPLKNRCGSCHFCADACVAQAIRNVSTEFHYADREEALDFKKCSDKLLTEFMLIPNVETPICGICIKVCPWGRKLKKRGKSCSRG